MGTIDDLGEELRQRLDQKYSAREKALTASRQIIRFSANSIRATHRAEFQDARQLYSLAADLVSSTRQDLQTHPDLYWTGYVQDAQKEYSEARITYALVTGDPIPRPEDLGVEVPPYMNGLAEAASELRRSVLDLIRVGNVQRAEQLLEIMDDIYSVLVTIDYPDAITGNLRRNTDLVRGVLERTRGDLTMSSRQSQLESALSKLQSGLKPGGS